MVSAGLMDLRDRLVLLLRRLGAHGDPSALFEQLVAAWSSPGRAYHDLGHLRDTLAALDAAHASDRERVLGEAALWFHDAVYDARSLDNEARSAAWAADILSAMGVSAADVAEVARLVRLTRHDHPPSDAAGQLVCDIDLAVLGREPAAFDQYETAVRAEYAWLDEAQWREGRRKVLSALLERRPLYRRSHFRARYEAQARDNLERALQRLTRSEP
jgi:predicted metal-dependent HD superfamily phosphohydrolase